MYTGGTLSFLLLLEQVTLQLEKINTIYGGMIGKRASRPTAQNDSLSLALINNFFCILESVGPLKNKLTFALVLFDQLLGVLAGVHGARIQRALPNRVAHASTSYDRAERREELFVAFLRLLAGRLLVWHLVDRRRIIFAARRARLVRFDRLVHRIAELGRFEIA